jgi:hypothetical protein
MKSIDTIDLTFKAFWKAKHVSVLCFNKKQTNKQNKKRPFKEYLTRPTTQKQVIPNSN